MSQNSYEAKQEIEEQLAYEEACLKGFNGTLEDFRRAKIETASTEPPSEVNLDDDLPF